VLHALTASGLPEAIMSDSNNLPTIPGLTAAIVSAYVSNHSLATADVGRLVGVVAEELGGLGRQPEPPAGPEPAVPVRESVRRDHLVCLVCGKAFKSLRRHLQSAHGLTPAAYRAMFDLARDYPIVAAAYTELRAAMARRSGLGRRRAAEPMSVSEAPAEPPPTRGPEGTTPPETVAAAATGPQPALRLVRGRRAPKAANVTTGVDLAQQLQPDPEPEPRPRRARRPKSKLTPD
jgi:predicted transcriptional regulator